MPEAWLSNPRAVHGFLSCQIGSLGLFTSSFFCLVSSQPLSIQWQINGDSTQPRFLPGILELIHVMLTLNPSCVRICKVWGKIFEESKYFSLWVTEQPWSPWRSAYTLTSETSTKIWTGSLGHLHLGSSLEWLWGLRALCVCLGSFPSFCDYLYPSQIFL